jgi:hypothetical protein
MWTEDKLVWFVRTEKLIFSFVPQVRLFGAMQKPESRLKVGDQVWVESRTWPGVNRPGGPGRITKVLSEDGSGGLTDGTQLRGKKDGIATTGFTYDIKYVLGGNERRVDDQW